MEWFNGIMTFLSLIFAFVVILGLAYVTTKIVASASFKKYKNKNMRLLEGMQLGPQKSLQLVKVGNKVILLALTKDNVTKLETFYPNELLISDEVYDENIVTFQDVFKNITKNVNEINKNKFSKLVSNYNDNKYNFKEKINGNFNENFKEENNLLNDNEDQEIKTIIRKTRSSK